MCCKHNRYAFGNRPEQINDLPRDSSFGTIVDEVGVYEKGPGKDYWKVIQRIETGKQQGVKTIIRNGYYVGKDGDWSWSTRPMMLEPSILNELYARAVSNGIVSR